MLDARSVMFSAVTRNSLAVLPLALTLTASLSIGLLAVVTQTLDDLVAILIQLVAHLAPLAHSVSVAPEPPA